MYKETIMIFFFETQISIATGWCGTVWTWSEQKAWSYCIPSLSPRYHWPDLWGWGRIEASVLYIAGGGVQWGMEHVGTGTGPGGKGKEKRRLDHDCGIGTFVTKLP